MPSIKLLSYECLSLVALSKLAQSNRKVQLLFCQLPTRPAVKNWTSAWRVCLWTLPRAQSMRRGGNITAQPQPAIPTPTKAHLQGFSVSQQRMSSLMLHYPHYVLSYVMLWEVCRSSIRICEDTIVRKDIYLNAQFFERQLLESTVVRIDDCSNV